MQSGQWYVKGDLGTVGTNDASRAAPSLFLHLHIGHRRTPFAAPPVFFFFFSFFKSPSPYEVRSDGVARKECCICRLMMDIFADDKELILVPPFRSCRRRTDAWGDTSCPSTVWALCLNEQTAHVSPSPSRPALLGGGWVVRQTFCLHFPKRQLGPFPMGPCACHHQLRRGPNGKIFCLEVREKTERHLVMLIAAEHAFFQDPRRWNRPWSNEALGGNWEGDLFRGRP